MLGEELRAARLAANLTQEELADEAGISRNYVSLLELNRKSPTVDVLSGADCGVRRRRPGRVARGAQADEHFRPWSR